MSESGIILKLFNPFGSPNLSNIACLLFMNLKLILIASVWFKYVTNDWINDESAVTVVGTNDNATGTFDDGGNGACAVAWEVGGEDEDPTLLDNFSLDDFLEVGTGGATFLYAILYLLASKYGQLVISDLMNRVPRALSFSGESAMIPQKNFVRNLHNLLR